MARLARSPDFPITSLSAATPGRRDRQRRAARRVDRRFRALFSHPEDEAAMGAVSRSASAGRPGGGADWIAALARKLARARRGPKPKTADREGDGDLLHTVPP